MAEKFLMPKLSPTMEEGQISRWIKNEGDSFEANETLAEVDTDKATMEMTSLRGGTLLKILKQGGDTAALGEPIAIIGDKGEDISAILDSVSSPVPSAAKENGTPKAESKETEKTPASSPAPPIAKETGPEKKQNKDANNNGRMLVSPIAARMAADNGIDLRNIEGSGPNGRIIKRDIEKALSGEPSAQKTDYVTSTQIGASPYRDETTSKMRKVIAERLVESIGPVPTFYLTTEIEMDRVIAARKEINEQLDEESKISVNDVIVKAAALSLVKHPWVNSSYRGDTVRFYEHADIGIAVAIDEGLITPVVRGANLKGLGEISREIKELAAKAKDKKLQPEEYTGATFSISNLGMMGIKEFTAIINPPEAAIIAVGGATQTPVVRNGEVVVRSVMHVTMSCDHRVVDGATGAKFLQTFKKMLENPSMMLL